MTQTLTIGILYPGEMGAALGRLLRAAGHRVVTTLDGRSQRTVDFAAAAGIEALGCVEEVVEASDMILSLVTPEAALSLAHEVAACHKRPAGAIYVDANSISPMKARRMAHWFQRRGVRFVDASIHGPASRLSELGRLYVSGADADEVAEFFASFVAVRPLGEEPGRASAMKMLLSGMVKGLVALFIEMSLAGREAGLLEEFLLEITKAYPGVMTILGRTLPTYPRHAARRVEEVSNLETTIRSLGLEPHMASATRRVIERLANSDLRDYAQANDDGLFDLNDLVELIALHCNPKSKIKNPKSRSRHAQHTAIG